MGQIIVKKEAVVHARPEEVYATIADYREGHPRIIPPENLYDLQIEQGGYGAGTVIRFKSRLFGIEQPFHHRVSEPDPGRVIREDEIDAAQKESNLFIVTPLGDGQKSRVEIVVMMDASPGLKGLIERALAPMGISGLLRKELKLLETVAQQRQNRPAASK